jgi:hypothetical protein
LTEKAVGINTRNADQYVAAFVASEQVDGHDRLTQIVSLTAGKVGTGDFRLSVSTNDSEDVTTISGNLLVGDNNYLVFYTQHIQPNGCCLLTPLLCDSGGTVIGYLPPKLSSVQMPVTVSGKYLSACLSWAVMSTGAYYIYPLITGLSGGNSVDVYAYTF